MSSVIMNFEELIKPELLILIPVLYGAISSNADVSSINHFSFAYFGALFSLVTAIQIILH